MSNWRKSKGSKKSKKELPEIKRLDGIFLESRTKYKGPLIGANNYNEYKIEREIPGNITLKEALEERQEQKKESNKIRSLSKKYLKAYLKGKSQFRSGKDENGEPNIINISSNEFSIHKKV